MFYKGIFYVKSLLKYSFEDKDNYYCYFHYNTNCAICNLYILKKSIYPTFKNLQFL